MKLLTCLAITIALTASLAAQTPKPIHSGAEAQAKLELNKAAEAYREGNKSPFRVGKTSGNVGRRAE